MYDRAEHIVIGRIGSAAMGAVADHWTGLVKRTLLVLAALVSAPLAWAQGDDKAYCTQLSELYRRYVQNATGRRVDVEALQALDDCSRGRPATAIPVLEKRLRDAKITVPGGGEFKP